MAFLARRLFLVGAVLAALAMLMAPLAGADDDDDDDGGGGDRAFCAPEGAPEPGQCSILAGTVEFDFDASSGPLGANPTGTFRAELGAEFVEVRITCLQVTVNRASFGGVVTGASTNPSLVGQGAAFTVLDNTLVGPDLLSDGTILPTPPTATTPDCGDVAERIHVVEGDIVVQDNTGGGGDDDEDDDDDEDEDDEDDEDEDDD